MVKHSHMSHPRWVMMLVTLAVAVLVQTGMAEDAYRE
jgi:hypothetical protein